MWNHKIANKVIQEIRESDRLEKFIEDKKTWIDGEDIEFIQVTIGFNDDGEWTHQTGDNSYTGSVYGMPHWLVTEIYPDTTPQDFIDDLQGQSDNIMG